MAAIIAALLVSGPAGAGADKTPRICAACVKANLEHLAGDALRGRECGSADENAAARYLADTLRASHVLPGLADGGYIQPVELKSPTYLEPPTVDLTLDRASLRLILGQEMVSRDLPAELTAPLVLVTDPSAAPEAVKGRAVIYDAPTYDGKGVRRLTEAGAALVITVAPPLYVVHWIDAAARSPGATQVEGVAPTRMQPAPVVMVRPELMDQVRRLAGGQVRVVARPGPPRLRRTAYVLGRLPGTGPDADRRSILLTAHYDHLGVRNGVIFHGANDDASGTAAVLELARALGAAPAHRRTAWFALFGCEEEGALAAQAFLARPPMPLKDLSANIEFEMIGADDARRPGVLMLTGWERTNLGPTLAAHGAKLGPDLYPDEHFFQRSDNYELALRGVVAQTVSGWPHPPTYHAASDDIAHLDLPFMDRAIGSMIAPVSWLLDSDFQPSWNAGQQP